MSNNQNFKVVKKYIDKMDYYSLLSQGAPKNEFDSETKRISALITPEQSELEIAETIAKVFNESFSNSDSPKDFINTAREIKQKLKNINHTTA